MRTVLAVAAAGGLGAAARFGMGVWLAPGEAGVFPWATFLCNCLGSLALGLWLGYSFRRSSLSKPWKEAVGTGFIGSFTTFSAFSSETVELIRLGETAGAILYLSTSFLCGIILAWLGLTAAPRIGRAEGD